MALALAIGTKQLGRSRNGDLVSFHAAAIGAHRESEHRKTVANFQAVRANLGSHYDLVSVLLSDSRTISMASISSELAGIGPCSRSNFSTDEHNVSPIILAQAGLVMMWENIWTFSDWGSYWPKST